MKKFRFKLATVLQVRMNRQQEALVALGAAQRAFQLEQMRKQALLNELQESLKRREVLATEFTSILSFQIEQSFINGTKQRIIQADQAIVRAGRGVEKSLKAYIAARKQTRMIEVLEEKERREFRIEQNKKEQKALDELVVMRTRLREEFA